MLAFIQNLIAAFPGSLRDTLLVGLGFSFLAIVFPRTMERIFRTVESPLCRLSKSKALVILLLFTAVIVVRLAVVRQLPVPLPRVHDEYSYLLLGDTLAHGRLANPTHPMWISFETFHVNWIPTYSSKYPPGQGVVLAIGQLLGHPWIAVLLSVGAMCAAIVWMLQAWLPARWALLGGVLAGLKFGIASYWVNSYWGGAVAAMGGALVLGAMARIVRHAWTRDALLLGVGIAILANSRPYEGLIFCIPISAWFLWWLAGKTNSRVPLHKRMARVFVPLAIVLSLTVGFLGYYNWRLTGNALLFPYVLHARTYDSVGLFLWQHPRESLHYRNKQLADFYDTWEREQYDNTWQDVQELTREKLRRWVPTYLWLGAILALPGLLFTLFDRKMRLPLAIALVSAVGSLLAIWSMPHYVAPLTCVTFLLLVQAMRHLRTIRPAGRPLGIALSWAAVALLGTLVGSEVSAHHCDALEWTCRGDIGRATMAERLSGLPGKHLVLVHYDEDHDVHEHEWVYNGAEIDSAKVLWARDISPQQNAKLFAYFNDRRIWLVNPDEDSTELVPYEPGSAAVSFDNKQ
jgi:hypothetical protein